MLPHYNPSRKPSARWDRFTDWLDYIRPYIVIIGIVGAIYMFFYWMMPRCAECNHFVHPMDVYCAQCGHQLRTTD